MKGADGWIDLVVMVLIIRPPGVGEPPQVASDQMLILAVTGPMSVAG